MLLMMAQARILGRGLHSHFVIAGIGPFDSHQTHPFALDTQYQQVSA
jgi:hypothetical protein